MIDLLLNKSPCWDTFHQVGAEQRIEIVNIVQNKINDAEKIETSHHGLGLNRIDLSDWGYWVLKELFWADLEWCELI